MVAVRSTHDVLCIRGLQRCFDFVAEQLKLEQSTTARTRVHRVHEAAFLPPPRRLNTVGRRSDDCAPKAPDVARASMYDAGDFRAHHCARSYRTRRQEAAPRRPESNQRHRAHSA